MQLFPHALPVVQRLQQATDGDWAVGSGAGRAVAVGRGSGGWAGRAVAVAGDKAGVRGARVAVAAGVGISATGEETARYATRTHDCSLSDRLTKSQSGQSEREYSTVTRAPSGHPPEPVWSSHAERTLTPIRSVLAIYRVCPGRLAPILGVGDSAGVGSAETGVGVITKVGANVDKAIAVGVGAGGRVGATLGAGDEVHASRTTPRQKTPAERKTASR
jgi:hypothetical protein